MLLSRILIILFFIFPVTTFASHNRGGEITYTHIGGLSYEFTITTCTDLGSSTGTDRPELYIDFDLGSSFAQRDTFQRATQTPLMLNHQKNTYVGVHTFTSTGTHRITMEDPNRNAGVLNVFPGGNSDDIVFALESYLIISPSQGSSGGNNSVQFDECPCPAIACVNKAYCYNPMAFDLDGDSLSYELVPPLGAGANPLNISNYYVYPDIIGGGNFSIDPVFGTVCWNNPMQQGEYNFTIKISEWRNGYPVGTVIRDVQLTVQNNCPNNPPIINPIPDTCVQAGNTLNFNIQGTDPDFDFISLTISGLPLNLNNSPANFSSVSSSGVANGIFQWQTSCNHIKTAPYQLMVELEDNGQPVFSDYEPFSIEVRPPPVTGLSTQPLGNTVVVKWNKAVCPNALGYNIYRKSGQVSTFEECCGSPDIVSTGMVLVDQKTSINDTVFIDNNILTIGVSYCYLVTATYDYGLLESCPSDTACAKLKKEVPIITNVSVANTSFSNGTDSIAWVAPTELDTTQYPGPYLYKIFDKNGNQIFQTPSALLLNDLDTNYNYSLINTTDTNRYYSLAIYYTNNGTDSLVGYSAEASSIHLNTIPNDNQIELFWSELVPWVNSYYLIYRSDSLNGIYNQIDSVNSAYYLDSGLINNENYCYFIESYGAYSDSTIFSPLINRSQKVCDQPFDFTPPCAPVLSIEGDCESEFNTLLWTNPNDYCSDDAVSYDLYFSPFLDSIFSPIQSFENIEDTLYQHQFNFNGVNSIAGCYYITATDSVLYSNESLPSDTVCFDNCPNYLFPNVFTPNKDINNDFFQALMPIKFISEIDLHIFNRWGLEVYQTQNPNFMWSGNNIETNLPCPTGIYYFQCSVSAIRLFGIENLQIKGFLHLIREKNQNNQ